MYPDLILLNGDIVTMDPFNPCVRALAVMGGRVVALGDDATIRDLAGPQTRIVNAGGRMVLPGLQDTHMHLQDSGYDYACSAELDDVRTIPDLQRVMREFAVTSTSAWVLGVGWYTGVFTDETLTRQVLDQAVPDRPCYILGSDGHLACINTLGCKAVGLDETVADPVGGHFVRDASGMPTGMLHESAKYWVKARMPLPTDADYADGVRYGQALANRNGITGIIDAAVRDRHFRVYRGMDMAGDLTLRIGGALRIEPSEETAPAVERITTMRAESISGQMFYGHSAKFFIDGVFENRTATMLDDYVDAVGGNAATLFDYDQLIELYIAVDKARFQTHAHAVGDGAVRVGLDAISAARAANGHWPALHQITHIQNIDPADVPRFAELGAVANIQTFWARNAPSVHMASDMVGPERTKWMYAFRALLDARAPYALSSDWAVSTLNPFKIMETAITRQPPNGADVAPFLPEQALTRAECLTGYTLNAAAAAWRSHDTGSLSVGRFADLIVIDRDFFTCDAHEIGNTQVLLTLLAGAEVWRDPAFAG